MEIPEDGTYADAGSVPVDTCAYLRNVCSAGLYSTTSLHYAK